MRDTFIRTFQEIAATTPEMMLITGDLGFGVLTEFAEKSPRQFINAGVAEQNMTGVAAGLAFEGHIVFTYSIANFPTLRCLEQIRNDVLYHDLPVNIVAVGGGFSYGALGMSHHATEDIAIMRSLPNLRIFTPSDDTETEFAVHQMINDPAPSYLRLDKSKLDAGVAEGNVQPDALREIKRGGSVSILGYGGIMSDVMTAVRDLGPLSAACQVYSVPCIKPLPVDDIRRIAENSDALLVVEEHLKYGGLASAVADIISDNGIRVPVFRRLGLPDQYSSIVGSQEYLRDQHGLGSEGIGAELRNLLK